MPKRVISFSLFGDDPMYRQGALENLRLSRELYPQWSSRFYVSQEIPASIVSALREGGGEVVPRDRKSRYDGLFWRFLPIDEPDLDALIVRDADSRMCGREVAAVEHWLRSGRGFHIMRDHPLHQSLILGGMWGCRGRVLPDLGQLMRRWRWTCTLMGRRPFGTREVDQHFLGHVVYPLIKDDVLIHSELLRFEGEETEPFPQPRKGLSYVGQSYDGAGRVLHEQHVSMLQQHHGQTLLPFPSYRNHLMRLLGRWVGRLLPRLAPRLDA